MKRMFYLLFFLLLPFLTMTECTTTSTVTPTTTVTLTLTSTATTTSILATVRVTGTILISLDKKKCKDGDKVNYSITRQGVPNQHHIFGETRIQIFSSSEPDFSSDVTTIIPLMSLETFDEKGSFTVGRSGQVFVGCALCYKDQCSYPIEVQNQSSVSIEVLANSPSSVPSQVSSFTPEPTSQPVYKAPSSPSTSDDKKKKQGMTIKASLVLILLSILYCLV